MKFGSRPSGGQRRRRHPIEIIGEDDLDFTQSKGEVDRPETRRSILQAEGRRQRAATSQSWGGSESESFARGQSSGSQKAISLCDTGCSDAARRLQRRHDIRGVLRAHVLQIEIDRHRLAGIDHPVIRSATFSSERRAGASDHGLRDFGAGINHQRIVLIEQSSVAGHAIPSQVGRSHFHDEGS